MSVYSYDAIFDIIYLIRLQLRCDTKFGEWVPLGGGDTVKMPQITCAKPS